MLLARRKQFLVLVILQLCLAIGAIEGRAEPSAKATTVHDCSRIVTLAPSLTEVIFELGLGDRLVGVSRYDRYPEAVISLAKVGGFLDPNLEAIVQLRPSFVPLVAEASDMSRTLERFKISTLIVDHRRVGGIINSISQIGDFCGVSSRASALISTLKISVEETQTNFKITANPLPAPVSTLIVVGREGGDNRLGVVYVSGSDGFYSDILKLAGGKNVMQGPTAGLSTISIEGMMALNPQAIIEIASEPLNDEQKASRMQKWQQFVGAKKSSHQESRQPVSIAVIDDEFAVIPGPRYPQLVKRFAEFFARVARNEDTMGLNEASKET